jgi:hypothetical protein
MSRDAGHATWPAKKNELRSKFPPLFDAKKRGWQLNLFKIDSLTVTLQQLQILHNEWVIFAACFLSCLFKSEIEKGSLSLQTNYKR